MKPLDVMKLLTKDRKPSFEYSPLETLKNCKDYIITDRQYQWLLIHVYSDIRKNNKEQRIVKGWQPINGVTYTDGLVSYSIVSKHKKVCIRVSDYTSNPILS